MRDQQTYLILMSFNSHHFYQYLLKSYMMILNHLIFQNYKTLKYFIFLNLILEKIIT